MAQHVGMHTDPMPSCLAACLTIEARLVGPRPRARQSEIPTWLSSRCSSPTGLTTDSDIRGKASLELLPDSPASAWTRRPNPSPES